ncbi:MAG: large protein, partial [Chitinophagaceae bacterium]|nr:large protein [Chitinophagaceae bacterium]
TGATAATTTNSTTVSYSNAATSGTLNVVANNSCGVSSAARSIGITVNPLPGQPGAFTTSTTSVCQGQTAVSYIVGASSPAATSYTWTYTGGTGATITGTTTSATVNYSNTATSGTISVSGINTCGNSATPRTLAITVNTTPYITTGNSSPSCVGTTLNLTVTTVTGAGYSWTGPNTFTSSSQNPTLTYTTAAGGTYTVVATLGTCTNSSNTVVTTSGTPGLWIGATNTDWNTGSNWCGGAVPTTTTDVTIQTATNIPVITLPAVNVRALIINSSAVLIKSPTGTLNIYGDFINNGTFTDNGIYTDAGSVIFNKVGAVVQNISGANLVFNNLTINNSNGVNLNSTATVNGILTLKTGALATNGNLNQNLYNGAIAGTGTGTTTGNIRFFKLIYGDKYHYLSAPIGGLTAANWNDNETVKFSPYNNLFTYDETVNDTVMKKGWTPVTSLSASLSSMQGFAFYFKQNVSNTLLDVSGAYAHGANYSVSLTNTPCTNPVAKPAADGWQLVGNPYPSTIDWGYASAGGWTKTNINNAIYSWDARTNRYASYVGGSGSNGGSRYIGSMQAFFVKVNNTAGGTLAMTNAVRTTSTLIDVWRTSEDGEDAAEDILRLTASSGDYSDETVIRFNHQATEGFDGDWDAYKLENGGNAPNLYTVSSNIEYAINSLPNTLIQKTIPLDIATAFSGNYTITADISGFTSEQNIILEDRTLGTFQDLRTNNSYTTTLNKGITNGRFFIQYANNSIETVTSNSNAQNNNEAIDIAAYQQTVSVLFPNNNAGNADISIFDALGKKVYEQKNADISTGKIEATVFVTTGIYIVQVNTGNTAASQQVYLTK